MRKFLISLVCIGGLSLSAGAFAQTTVNSTTLAAALDATATSLSVTSATNVAAGNILFIDQEAVFVTSLSGTIAQVRRGYAGTAARAHAALAVLYTGTPAQFGQSEVTPGATCTATAELYTPRIVLPSGTLYTCTNSVWVQTGAAINTIQASFVQGGTAADALDTIFFIADRPYVVTAISAIWGTAESTGSMDIMVEKLTGTTACASGTDLLSAAIAGTGTANTVNAGALSTTASAHQLAAGNRLCVDLSATPNEVVNMVVTVTLAPR